MSHVPLTPRYSPGVGVLARLLLACIQQGKNHKTTVHKTVLELGPEIQQACRSCILGVKARHKNPVTNMPSTATCKV